MTTEQYYNMTPTQEKIFMRKVYKDNGKRKKVSQKTRAKRYIGCIREFSMSYGEYMAYLEQMRDLDRHIMDGIY